MKGTHEGADSSLGILARLCEVAPPIILRHHGRSNSCIASTRIGMEVLRHFGITSYPLPMKFSAWNERAHELLSTGRGAEVGRTDPVAYGVAAGVRPAGLSGWDGHLVLIARMAAGEHLLDLSAEQANRPEKGIVTRAFYTPYEAPGKDQKLVLLNPNGGSIVYEVDVDNDRWKRAPDWDLSRWRGAVTEVLAAMRS